MSYARLVKLIDAADRVALKAETDVANRVKAAVDAAYRAAMEDVRRRYNEVSDRDLAGKERAVLLLNELGKTLYLLDSEAGKQFEADLKELGAAMQAQGASLAEAMAKTMEPGFTVRSTVRPNLEAAAYQAKDGLTRLRRHDADFALKASKAIEAGLISGESFAKVQLKLQDNLGALRARAESIVRTESMAAMDSANRAGLKDLGIEYYQRIATQDTRVCPTCAARAGDVFEVGVPVSLHPMERCYAAPWKKAWVDSGALDSQWIEAHKADVVAKAGGVNEGPSPFERLNGTVQPVPVWRVGGAEPKSEPRAWPESLEGLEEVRSLGGSTGARLVRDASGQLYVLKRGANEGHLRDEFLADGLYRDMGLNVPEARLYETDDGPVKLAKFIEGRSLAELGGDELAKARARLSEGFAVDALLGNWDVVGLSSDNVLVDGQGEVWRIDNGGALRYRAQGGLKGDAWNDYPTELWTLRDSGINPRTAEVFGGMAWGRLVAQVEALSLPERLGPVGDRLKARLSEMQRLAAIGRTFEVDGWVDSYTEAFARHSLGLRSAGLPARLSRKLYHVGQGRVVDEDGNLFDNIRTEETLSALHEYFKSQGLDWERDVDGYRQAQGNSSWGWTPMAVKAFFQAQRPSATAEKYFWLSPFEEARELWRAKGVRWEQAMTAAHAWTYEMLSAIDIPGKTSDGLFVWRTEDDGVLDEVARIPRGSSGVYKRGVVESGSLFSPVVAVSGAEVTTARVPLHRVFAEYLTPSRTPGTGALDTGFLADSENEITVMFEGLAITREGGFLDYRPPIFAGFEKPPRQKQSKAVTSFLAEAAKKYGTAASGDFSLDDLLEEGYDDDWEDIE